ncbi:MAG: hypothetical protein ABUS51_10450 [Acidobacteriota bacterium]
MIRPPQSEGRRLLFLAPVTSPGSSDSFGHSVVDPSRHEGLLAALQRLRGQVYAGDGAIPLSGLDPAGRYSMAADEESWHLILLDKQNLVSGCVRFLVHRPPTVFDRLQIRHSALSRSSEWGQQVRSAVAAEMRGAQECNSLYVEVGGWALSAGQRGSTAAVMFITGTYAWSQLIGGCFGLCTATERHRSASLLRRAGGSPLAFRGDRLPAYYDSAYGCRMEILRFDSRTPSPRLLPLVAEMKLHLAGIPVIRPAPSTPAQRTREENRFSDDLERLNQAVTPTVPSELISRPHT